MLVRPVIQERETCNAFEKSILRPYPLGGHGLVAPYRISIMIGIVVRWWRFYMVFRLQKSYQIHKFLNGHDIIVIHHF